MTKDPIYSVTDLQRKLIVVECIKSTGWRLWCEPDSGVQWMAAQILQNDNWHHVVPDCRPSDTPANQATHATSPAGMDTSTHRAGQDETAPLQAANFHMLPYSNRIRDGRFSFDGKLIQLEGADRHAIHGALRKLPWQITSQSASEIVCRFSSEQQSTTINWPWPLVATLRHKVHGYRLESHMTLTNAGSSPMPAGLGWHPYFVREISGSMPTLTLPVDHVFPDETGDCLPDGAPVALPETLNFQLPRQLDPAQRIDCCLSGLQGECVLDWRDAGIRLTLKSSDVCHYLVLFNPDMPHFAVEPVTNANDAFNLHHQGIDAGVQVLQPRETLSASMIIDAECRKTS